MGSLILGLYERRRAARRRPHLGLPGQGEARAGRQAGAVRDRRAGLGRSEPLGGRPRPGVDRAAPRAGGRGHLRPRQRGGIRHGTKVLRWRERQGPDCLDQLEAPANGGLRGGRLAARQGGGHRRLPDPRPLRARQASSRRPHLGLPGQGEARAWSTELAPYETGERGSGDPSRWASGRDLEWIELRPELVVEVTFDHVSDGRIRHGTKVLRWRDDKDPKLTSPASTEGRSAYRSSRTSCRLPRSSCTALRRHGWKDRPAFDREEPHGDAQHDDLRARRAGGADHAGPARARQRDHARDAARAGRLRRAGQPRSGGPRARARRQRLGLLRRLRPGRLGRGDERGVRGRPRRPRARRSTPRSRRRTTTRIASGTRWSTSR